MLHYRFKLVAGTQSLDHLTTLVFAKQIDGQNYKMLSSVHVA